MSYTSFGLLEIGHWCNVDGAYWDFARRLQDSIYTWLPFVRVQEYLLSAYTRAGSKKTKSSDSDLQATLETHIGNEVMGKGKLVAVNNIIFDHPPCPEAYALVKNEDNPPAERSGLNPISNKVYTNTLKLYPNPGSTELNISLDSEQKLKGELSLRDLHGRLLMSKRDFVSGNKYTLSIQHLPSGLYLVELKTDSGLYIHKFLKE